MGSKPPLLVLSSARAAPGGLATSFESCSAAYTILYRTTNSRNEPAWAVTTLLVPVKPVSDTIPYDSASVGASPSASIYSPHALGGNHIRAAISRGWHVSMPDYEGPLASFTLGIQSGQATLDSVRAVLYLAGNPQRGFDIKLSPNAKYALWGYSGGSIVSEWAAELQPSYAAELSFAELAMGGMITSVWRVLESVTGKMLAGLIPSGLLGMTTQYPEARAHLLSRLKADKREAFLAAVGMDMDQAMNAFAFHDIFGYFEGGEEDLRHATIQDIISREGSMGSYGVPRMPVFAYAAKLDELTPIAGAEALFAKYAEEGANIPFHRNEVGHHLVEFENGRERALKWLESVLTGKLGLEVGENKGYVVVDVSVLDEFLRHV